MDASIRSRSALITIAIHVGLFLILFYTLMKTQIPPFPEANGGGGLRYVSIGTVDEAAGEIQPMSEVIKETAPVVKPVKAPDEELATQETEEAVAVKVNKDVKKTATPKPTPVVAKPVERKVDQTALYKGSTTSKSQGNSSGSGDQGEKNGGPVGYTGKSGNGAGGSGNGTGDANGPGSGSGPPGISFSLSGRSLVKKPIINDHSQETGKVVVEITVDKNGLVTFSNPGVRGTTTSSPLLFKLAKEAAMQAKFSPSETGADIQRGTITFVFVVQ